MRPLNLSDNLLGLWLRSSGNVDLGILLIQDVDKLFTETTGPSGDQEDLCKLLACRLIRKVLRAVHTLPCWSARVFSVKTGLWGKKVLLLILGSVRQVGLLYVILPRRYYEKIKPRDQRSY